MLGQLHKDPSYCESSDDESDILNIPELPQEAYMDTSSGLTNNKYLIPPQKTEHQGKLTVILDLDETLGQYRRELIYWRPGYEYFLDSIKNCCEVILWTASTEDCLTKIKNTLDPNQDRIHYYICRNDSWFHCIDEYPQISYTKDLRLLGRSMSRTLIVENTLACVVLNPNNAILVADYLEPNPHDKVLSNVQEIIMPIAANSLISIPEYLHQRTDILTKKRTNIRELELFYINNLIPQPSGKPSSLSINIFKIGERVRVRDSIKDKWRSGKVISIEKNNNILVLPDEWSSFHSQGLVFKYYEKETSSKISAPNIC